MERKRRLRAAAATSHSSYAMNGLYSQIMETELADSRRRQRTDSLRAFHAIVRQRSFVHIKTKTRILWN